jgi:hypothetical protein
MRRHQARTRLACARGLDTGSTEKEREIARERLENLLTGNRKTWGDLVSLLAISENNPERRMDNGGDENPPSPPSSLQQGENDPDAFELIDWMLRRFLYLQDHQFTALTLWILHTYIFNDFGHSPRLVLTSPVRNCKSVALDLCEKLCLRPRKFGSTTTAVLPRLTHNNQATILLDEADNMDFAGEPVLRAVFAETGFAAPAVR